MDVLKKSNTIIVMHYRLIAIVIHCVLTFLVEARTRETVYPPLDLRKKSEMYQKVRDQIGTDYMSLKNKWKKDSMEVVGEPLDQEDVQELVAEIYDDLQASDKAIEGIEVCTKCTN